MMSHSFRSLLFIAITFTTHTALAQKAFIIVPVANAIGAPINDESAINDYNCMCASWGPTAEDKIICPRIHQFLFNEQVTIIKEQDGQVLVESPTAFYEDKNSNESNQYWTLKKYVMPFQELKRRNLMACHVPKPLGAPTAASKDGLMITLKLPFYDEITNRTYSAGTRFVALQPQDDFIAWVYDPSHHIFQTIHIPESVVAPLIYETKEEQILEFVNLLLNWAKRSEGKVPFIWGGASLTHFYPRFQFSLKEKMSSSGKKARYWSIHHQLYPLAGFDTSGLILRAAQICQIPYFFKNTTTARTYLKKMSEYASLKNGDILWIPGALLVISSVRHNKVIAILGYQFGYGALKEFKLAELFEDVSTYQELQELMANKDRLIMKKADGSVAREIKEYQFLSLRSLN
ncbi:hypothetical protein HYX58_01005 [Candidatus Dependentiae bacterium]|nr:hypothetical protein [Candidatus Dependentiae bacterium]